MNFITTKIKGLLIVEPKIWKDDRGYFFESYNKKCFDEAGIHVDFVQDNQSLSQKGTLRGLHAQADPHAQGKLVRVIHGRVLDVAVDIRKDSETYGQHLAIELSGDTNQMLWVPPGFLHGFVTLENDTIFTYKVSGLYNKSSEFGVLWNDPELNIDWVISQDEMILSEKDQTLPLFKDLSF
ncbi:dTDP-4-dehydrorhamnose 3,5-epimerase [Daejeonella rubra]|uniref:dTDP-4-dehydrorhamnose 3,5-epimerase n=1 Tax=Daejeonella rubra TaxID=990371 RepID=A0A1G9U3R3_9SPHI|nr:dTDP-4-dehydrorhamnose 3,5-epimerase [Daejeonella rubra]SDM54576.1 dTDP-4-dehydrorhamnose 3,5-epimerase [Daejeonella rubra]